MATIAEISRQTGLAYSTVADILRERGGYREETRRRVQRVARELGYRPDPLGRALAGAKTMTVGVVSEFTPVVAIAERLTGFNQAAYEYHYAPVSVPHPTSADAQDIARDIRILTDWRVGGLLLATAPLAVLSEPVRAALRDATVPVVFMGRHTELSDALPGTTYRNEAAALQIAERLHELGHRRGRYVGTPTDIVNPQWRFDGYRDAFAAHGMVCDMDPRRTLDPSMPPSRSAYQIVSEIIRAGELPDVLMMSNDETALAATAAVFDAHLRVPEDVSIVGFDDGPASWHARPPLTSVRQPGSEMGRAAFQVLHTLMENPDAEVVSPSFDSQAVFRESIGPAPQRGKGAAS